MVEVEHGPHIAAMHVLHDKERVEEPRSSRVQRESCQDCPHELVVLEIVYGRVHNVSLDDWHSEDHPESVTCPA